MFMISVYCAEQLLIVKEKKHHLFHLHEKWHVTALIKEPPERREEEADLGITIILLPL